MRSLSVLVGGAVFVLLMVFASSRAHAADAHAKAREHYQRGESYFKLEKYKEALDEYEAGYIIKADPSVLYNIAQCHRLMGNNATALRFYKRFLDEGPKGGNRTAAEERIRELEGGGKTGTAVVVAPAPAAPAKAPAPVAPPARAQPVAAAPPPRAQPVAAAPPPPPPQPQPPPPAYTPVPAYAPPPPAGNPPVVLVQGPPPVGTPENPPPAHHSHWLLWTLLGVGVVVIATSAVIVATSAKSDPTCPSGRLCM
jgi:tetratricopeptide (TPR) repeat protein